MQSREQTMKKSRMEDSGHRRSHLSHHASRGARAHSRPQWAPPPAYPTLRFLLARLPWCACTLPTSVSPASGYPKPCASSFHLDPGPDLVICFGPWDMENKMQAEAGEAVGNWDSYSGNLVTILYRNFSRQHVAQPGASTDLQIREWDHFRPADTGSRTTHLNQPGLKNCDQTFGYCFRRQGACKRQH